MEISLRIVFTILGFLLLLSWIILEILRERSRNINDKEYKEQVIIERETSSSIKFIIVSNVLITISSSGFCLYQVSKLESVRIESIFRAITWGLVTVFVLYFKNKVYSDVHKWPLVLILWWIFSSILNAISISIYILNDMKYSKFSIFFPEANYADFFAFPFSSLMCFNAIHNNYYKKLEEIERPLLEKEDEDIDVYSNAGIWSLLTFRWLNPIFEKARTRRLELHHIPAAPESEKAEKSFSSLDESIQNQKTKSFSLPNAIIQSIWKPLAINAVFAGANTIASYMGPFFITNFVNFLSGKHDDSSNHYGIILAIIFLLAKTVESLTQRQWYFGANRIGIRVRAALMVSIYKKSLSIRNYGLSNGNIVNFISVDIERIGDFFWYIHGIWLLPLQVFLALLILYRNLGGAASMAALLATILVMVSNTPLANLQQKLNSKIMEARDSRIKAISETLKSMRVLKLHSWEITFLKKILNLRERERSLLKKYLYVCASIAFLFWTSPTLVSVVTFGVCIVVKTPLTSGKVLSALATFRILQEPIYNFPELMSMIAQTKVSIDRIQKFITEEGQKKLISHYTQNVTNLAIEIEAGEYTRETSGQKMKKPSIKITEKMEIKKGIKIAVCGSVGSGKSSLLSSILGEIPRTLGAEIKVYGSKAYVPQGAWIQTGTVQDNILFGKEMESDFYKDVVDGCALNKDIEMWVDGDLCTVGERGMNLSGGQKQRIQLARAVYSDADIYLLDDPFSAVDAHTGAHLFKECLSRLLRQKTVIYVTHQLEFLEASDVILVMEDGQIVQSGKYKDLIADSNGELVRQMTAHKKSINQVITPPQGSNCLTWVPHKFDETELTEEKSGNSNKNEKLSESIHEETESGTGRVKWKVYSKFVSLAYKGALIPVILLCQVLFQGLQISSNYWIAWATEEEERVSSKKMIGVFALLSGGSSIFILGRAVLLATASIETAQRLFLGMINSVFRAPISFFDSTPSSHILNRFSTDQSSVDTDIPYRLAGLAFALIQLVSIVILMSQVAWEVILFFIAILAISIWYQAYYITAARELARMVATGKSPILHHFSESIAGAAAIRCFNQEDRFLEININLIDDYSRLAFHNCATMEWLCVRINFLFNMVFFLVLVILVILPKEAISPSLAGLVATYGLNLNVLQAWVIWNLCNVENKMISVERILQFFNIPSEAPLEIDEYKPKPEWPINGTVEINNLKVQYNPSLPMVLKGVTCTFPGGKKIGVVGRTGSGKSTLIQALFRMVEPLEGSILIDGKDISKMGLQDLRSRLSIIPQDPTLFKGTVRTNLDPLNQHSESDIWEVVRKCHLEAIVTQDPRLLDAPVSDDGDNWSLGQRQLVCLARVLLKKRRILVLDEATASVDTATDNVIQKTIREETTNCTVITVAHRIPTVIDNDLVLVLDEGKVLEYNSPAQLLKENSSAFSKLVTEFLRRS